MSPKNLSILAVVVTLSSGLASGQEFPGLGVGDLWAANMAFDNQMMNNAANFAHQWYLDRQAYRHATGDWGYIPGPFTAADLNRANLETSQAYQSYNDSWHRNSAATSQAIGNYSQQAISGLGNFGDGMGTTYQLSNQFNGYFMDNYGQVTGTNDFVAPNPWQQYTVLSPWN